MNRTKVKLLLGIVLALIVTISVNYGENISRYVLSYTNQIKTKIVTVKDHIHQEINTFYHQKEQIKKLQQELQNSQKTALLSIAFASKLNHFLKESKLSLYDPQLRLVRAISFVKLGDFTKMWIDFPEFEPNHIYGLLYKGYAAGIVDNEKGFAVAKLLGNKETIFSVSIGEEGYLGIVFGNAQNIYVKYIPTYAKIAINDEVITSGNDNIFYEGIKVGRVVEIKNTTLYKEAIVKPYVRLKKPDFFYVVNVNKKFIKEINASQINDALK